MATKSKRGSKNGESNGFNLYIKTQFDDLSRLFNPNDKRLALIAFHLRDFRVHEGEDAALLQFIIYFRCRLSTAPPQERVIVQMHFYDVGHRMLQIADPPAAHDLATVYLVLFLEMNRNSDHHNVHVAEFLH